MNNVTARSNVAPLFTGERPARTHTTVSRPVVFLRQISTDQWLVHDRRNLRGGTFRDLKSAQKFIRSDFLPSATIVFHPHFNAQSHTS